MHDFFQNHFFGKILSGIPYVLLGLIWVQTVDKCNQQMTLVDRELNDLTVILLSPLVLFIKLQFVRFNKTCTLIWIKIVLHADCIPERIYFTKGNFKNNLWMKKKHAKLRVQNVCKGNQHRKHEMRSFRG